MTYTNKLSKKLGFGEEVANSVSHGLGAVIFLVLLPFSAAYTQIHHHTMQTVGVSIFMLSIFLMLMSSTIYHFMPYDSIYKYILRIIDHSMIFVAIAGSYTPIALSIFDGWLKYAMIITQWGITIGGILYKIFAKKVNEKFSTALYLIMGWLVIFMIKPLIQHTSLPFMLFIVLGGILYSIGAIFYSIKKPYFHMIWHLFILFACLSHFVAIVFFM